MATRSRARRKDTKPAPPNPSDWRLPPITIEQVFVPLAGQIVDWGVKLLNVPALWKRSAGKGVRVAVLDTGAPDHPDVAPAVVVSKDFTGSRFGARDVHGHGSHCAGIIGARDNQIGVVGVAPECDLIVGKVLGDNGSGSGQSVAAGIRWAAEQGADVISMSLGSPAPDQAIRSAIIDATRAGVYVIVAAGNSGPGPNTVDYPGKWPEVIAVASTNEAGQISRYSSRGPEVDIAAPGEQITSTYLNGQLGRLSGTSMATPFVAGCVALALAKYAASGRDDPNAPKRPSPSEMAERLRQCAKDIDAPGFDPNAGWGLVDPAKLLDGFNPADPLPPPVTLPGDVAFGPADFSASGRAKLQSLVGDGTLSFRAG